mmetsp:Transcript_30458/g.58610  ORF Transcript_30458/g.58610 Transcript_30458/m.58610 type:complete len:116 (+) Transcript_30458:82-429(+)
MRDACSLHKKTQHAVHPMTRYMINNTRVVSQVLLCHVHPNKGGVSTAMKKKPASSARAKNARKAPLPVQLFALHMVMEDVASIRGAPIQILAARVIVAHMERASGVSRRDAQSPL